MWQEEGDNKGDDEILNELQFFQWTLCIPYSIG